MDGWNSGDFKLCVNTPHWNKKKHKGILTVLRIDSEWQKTFRWSQWTGAQYSSLNVLSFSCLLFWVAGNTHLTPSRLIDIACYIRRLTGNHVAFVRADKLIDSHRENMYLTRDGNLFHILLVAGAVRAQRSLTFIESDSIKIKLLSLVICTVVIHTLPGQFIW